MPALQGNAYTCPHLHELLGENQVLQHGCECAEPRWEGVCNRKREVCTGHREAVSSELEPSL